MDPRKRIQEKNRQYGVTHFAIKSLCAAAIPALILFAIYAILDPFNVMSGAKHLDEFSHNKLATPHLSANKGYVSLTALEQRIKAGDAPDSFILGASISCYYEADYWQGLIGTAIKPFHFDSSSEGATSLRRKLEYLLKRELTPAHALIILDPKTIEGSLVSDNIVSMDHPDIAGTLTWIPWHYRHVMAFYDPEFLVSYLPSRFTSNTTTYGHKEIFERQPMTYDPYRNEESIPIWDQEISLHPDIFYAHRSFPTTRTLHCDNEHRIDKDRLREYRRIADILAHSDYHVIISPTLDCDTLSQGDDTLLREIFGADRYHNFTASMAHVALCDSNWYDTRHYRAPVARALMDLVYDNY